MITAGHWTKTSQNRPYVQSNSIYQDKKSLQIYASSAIGDLAVKIGIVSMALILTLSRKEPTSYQPWNTNVLTNLERQAPTLIISTEGVISAPCNTHIVGLDKGMIDGCIIK